jgi:hypothetical protein
VFDFNVKDPPVAVIETGFGIMLSLERSVFVFAETVIWFISMKIVINAVIVMLCFFLVMAVKLFGFKIYIFILTFNEHNDFPDI